MSAATPDFYHYPWSTISSVELDGRFVVVRWPDGTELRAYALWLAENVVGHTIDPVTRESVADPADLDLQVRPLTATVTADGALAVSWETGVDAVFHPGWLRHVADGRHRPDAWLPDPEPWLAADLGEPPSHDGKTALSDPAVVERWVDDLLRFGIARLVGAPCHPDTVLQVGARLGAIRDTNFGAVWDVKAVVDPDSTANTNLRLCPHTDLPTRETPPGFQFLHCVANSATGGFSTMADGLAVVDALRREHPDHYEALTTLNWVFFNRGPEVDHRWSAPIIDLGSPGRPLTLRAFHPVRGFPDMAEVDVPRAYAALACFSRVAADDRFQLRYPFRPGDIVGFDNRRILHGRDAYESAGERHLRGLYMDHDEVHSFARRVARRRAARHGAASSSAASDPAAAD